MELGDLFTGKDNKQLLTVHRAPPTASETASLSVYLQSMGEEFLTVSGVTLK